MYLVLDAGYFDGTLKILTTAAVRKKIVQSTGQLNIRVLFPGSCLWESAGKQQNSINTSLDTIFFPLEIVLPPPERSIDILQVSTPQAF